MRLISFIKETLTDAIKALTSKEGLKGLYGVSLYRNAVYLMLSQLAAALSGFVFWILAARLYEPADIGLASAAISAASLLAFFSSLGLGYGLIRLLAGSGGKSRAMINSTFAVSSLACLILSLLFLAGLNFWSPLLNFIRQSPLLLDGGLASPWLRASSPALVSLFWWWSWQNSLLSLASLLLKGWG